MMTYRDVFVAQKRISHESLGGIYQRNYGMAERHYYTIITTTHSGYFNLLPLGTVSDMCHIRLIYSFFHSLYHHSSYGMNKVRIHRVCVVSLVLSLPPLARSPSLAD